MNESFHLEIHATGKRCISIFFVKKKTKSILEQQKIEQDHRQPILWQRKPIKIFYIKKTIKINLNLKKFI